MNEHSNSELCAAVAFLVMMNRQKQMCVRGECAGERERANKSSTERWWMQVEQWERLAVERSV